MRGAWIASVANIDWPSKPGLSTEEQQTEFETLLDGLQDMGINAVFVQVRPSGDALYPTKHAPWSAYLTGVQGRAPEPYYDPLAYMIQSTHRRKMEFHAWLNPYRASFNLDTSILSDDHKLKALSPQKKREWFFKYGTRYYFNPANPEVVQHLSDIVEEIVARYDVDGIHFDDYFYPYKEKDAKLNDFYEYSQNKRGFTSIEDWRRDNVSLLIRSVSKKIKDIKPYVRFGISPFGVWRNKAMDPVNGSDTRAGLTCYDDLYADVLKWLREDWIDYVAPQIYWSIGFPPADYETLVDWWSKNLFGKHLYIGHATYKIGQSKNDPNWNIRSQTSDQIAMNRANEQVMGSIHFSAKQLMRNPLGVADTLRENLYTNKAFLPGMPYRTTVLPATPDICRVKGTRSTIKLSWNACEIRTGEEMPYYFAIYRFHGDMIGDFANPKNLIATTPYNTERWIYEDQTVYRDEIYTYVVTAFNRMNVQSYSSKPMTVKKTKKKVRKKRRRLFGWYL